MRMFTLFVALALLLAGCGGGGSTHVHPTPATPPTAASAPVRSERGADIDTVQMSFHQSSDGPSAARVADYLRVHASGGPWQSGPNYTWTHDPGLVRFEEPPTVRIATGASDRERAITHYAVALINRALPYESHLTIGPDAPAGVSGQWRQGLPSIPVLFRALARGITPRFDRIIPLADFLG